MIERNDPAVLLVGGDAPVRAMFRFLLEDDGCTVAEADAATPIMTASAACDAERPVVVIADDGARTLVDDLMRRRPDRRPPAVVVTRHNDPALRRRLLALGVRGTIAIPAPPADIRARLRAALGLRPDDPDGAAEASPPPIVRAGGLTLCVGRRTVDDGAGWEARLSHQEVQLLRLLMRTPGRVVDCGVLLDRLSLGGAPGDANALAVLIRRLRAKLARPGHPHGDVRTVRGRGYLFDARAATRDEDDACGDDRGRGERSILVVEDDQQAAEMIDGALTLAGYRVLHGVGPAAPILARRLRPRIILLDLNMPQMGGVDVRRHLRTSPRTADIPVVAMSAARNLRVRAAEIDADDYLAKPFSIDDLLLRVRKWDNASHSSSDRSNH